eukprot:2861513-Prymnesium_polylepis.1
MLPPTAAAASDLPAEAATLRGGRDQLWANFGLATNFAPEATVHGGRASCVIERRGCRSPSGLNYDALATVDA